MRSEGQVRFVTVSSRKSRWLPPGSSPPLCSTSFSMNDGRVELGRQSAPHQNDRRHCSPSARAGVADFRQQPGDLSRRYRPGRRRGLQRRHGIHRGHDRLASRRCGHGRHRSDSSSEVAEIVAKIIAVMPEAAALARHRSPPARFAERLTRFADPRSARAAAALRKLGLNPDTMLARPAREGGPFEKLSPGGDDALDPRFERLGLSLARMDALERGSRASPGHARRHADDHLGLRLSPRPVHTAARRCIRARFPRPGRRADRRCGKGR